MKVAVIGAGPAGLTAAYQLVKRNVRVEVFEAGSLPGGMAKTISLWNQKVDLGPHRFFSKDRRINELWLEVIGTDYQLVDRVTRIYYQDKFFPYPLKLAGTLANFGWLEAGRCALSYLRQKIDPAKLDGSFENWVVKRFGRRLFEIFFKHYSEKLWGVSCDELDSDFAAQRIQKLSLLESIRNLAGRNGNNHKTLVESFAYARDGCGTIYTRMADTIAEKGGEIFYQNKVKGVRLKDSGASGIELSDGQIRPYNRVISTMPLPDLLEQLEQAPARIKALGDHFRFRNSIIVYLNVQHSNLWPDQWIYVHDSNLITGRITNFRNWVSSLHGDEQNTILAFEYWCFEQDEIWGMTDSNLIALAEQDFRRLGLNAGAPILNGHVVRVKNCYPLYTIGYKKLLEPVKAYLQTIDGLNVIGRGGAFKYNNQDHSMLMGILAAENIVDNRTHDLWAINTDYEYQEAAVITQTGLESVNRP